MFIFICKTASEYLTIATTDKIKDTMLNHYINVNRKSLCLILDK